MDRGGHEFQRHSRTTSHPDRCSFEYKIFTRQFILPVSVSLNIQLDGWHLEVSTEHTTHIYMQLH